MQELDEAKLAMLKLRGWEFVFYPADLVEVFMPGERSYSDQGQFFGAWILPSKVEFFFAEEFGDGQ